MNIIYFKKWKKKTQILDSDIWGLISLHREMTYSTCYKRYKARHVFYQVLSFCSCGPSKSVLLSSEMARGGGVRAPRHLLHKVKLVRAHCGRWGVVSDISKSTCALGLMT